MIGEFVDYGTFPARRMRRNRGSATVRTLVGESVVRPGDLVWPLFVFHGRGREAVSSMEGVFRLDPSEASQAAVEAHELGIPAVMIFPQTPPDRCSEMGEEAWNPDNITCKAVRAIKERIPELTVLCDVALDPYTSHGHDGVLDANGRIDNDRTLEALKRQALCLARAGCDGIAPSDMMDGRVGVLRAHLDANGFADVLIISYGAKYASRFYGPFRDAIGSGGRLVGDKKTYQMHGANVREALTEVALDVKEGADMVIVKPGMPYLDVLCEVAKATSLPVLSYQVSGEYRMLRLLAVDDETELRALVMESLVGFKRAGARAVVTYFAPMAARWLREEAGP